eukprot:2851864-Amphidinium_carterae.1
MREQVSNVTCNCPSIGGDGSPTCGQSTNLRAHHAWLDQCTCCTEASQCGVDQVILERRKLVPAPSQHGQCLTKLL